MKAKILGSITALSTRNPCTKPLLMQPIEIGELEWFYFYEAASSSKTFGDFCKLDARSMGSSAHYQNKAN